MRWGGSAAFFCIISGCVTPGLIADNMIGTMQDMADTFFSEESPDHAFAAGPPLLKQLDGFIKSSPENRELLKFGAEMNCGFALTFLDEANPEWAWHLYSKGREYALRGLALSRRKLVEALRRKMEAEVRLRLAEVSADELPFLFWTGLCWAGMVNSSKDVTLVAELPIIESIIARSIEIDEKYYFGAGHLFFGMLYAGRTEMLGGDLEKGRKSFERALEVTGGRFLLTKVMFAKTYAVNAQDSGLFVELLSEVIRHSSMSPPEMRLANAVARQQAKRLLDRIGDYFPGYSSPEEGMAPLEEEDVDPDLDG